MYIKLYHACQPVSTCQGRRQAVYYVAVNQYLSGVGEGMYIKLYYACKPISTLHHTR